jgi:transaldolase
MAQGAYMKFFIDTANVAEIREAHSLGVLDGVTTNPSLIAKEKRGFRPLIDEICSIVPGPVNVEVVSTEVDGMIAEGEELASMAKNIVVKVPMTREGLKATKRLSEQGIGVNVTLIFSAPQALLAAKAGACYISPFVGRLDDIGHVGMDVVAQILAMLKNYPFTTEVLVASVRSPLHVIAAAQMGAHIATVPYHVLEQLLKHPLTDSGLQRFLADWHTLQEAVSAPAR